MATQTKPTEELLRLTRNWDGELSASVWEVTKARQIGKRLHEDGGPTAMWNALYEVRQQNIRATVVRVYWCGIGEWAFP